MTQDNLSSNDDRSQPRYQIPTNGGSGNKGAGANNSQPSGSGSAPNPATPDPIRPADWPAPPDPSQVYQAPGLAPGPNFGGYPAPPVNPGQTWGSPATPGSKNGKLYNYENYNSGAFPPPPPADPQAEAYRQAARRVRSRLDFQKNLWSYILVNGFLWMIYFLTTGAGHQSFWPIWITVFWGIGLFAQWWNLSGREDERRRRMVEEEMRRKNHF
jgi:hypothetical protein